MTGEMSTVGNLFLDVFRWKNEIAQQVKRNADLSIQHLNSKLLIQGIPPPPWILEDFQCPEAPRVLSKEDLISQILRQHPQPVIHVPQARCSLYNKSFEEGNGEKAGGIIAETHSSHECFDGGNEQGAESGWVEDNARCVVDAAPDFDIHVTTQQELVIHTPGTRDSPFNEPVGDGDEGVLGGGIMAETHSNHECFDDGNEQGAESGCVEDNTSCDVDAAPDFDADVTTQKEPIIHTPGTRDSPCNKPVQDGDETVRAGGIIAETQSNNHECFDSGKDNGVETGQADNGNDTSLAPVFDTDIGSHQPSEIGSPGAFRSPNNNPGGEGDEGVREGGEIKEHETCSNNGDQQVAASDGVENTTTGNWNMVPEFHSNVISPHDIEVRISTLFNAPDQSVARIQRSKSRQKALELRNSAKTESRSRLNQQNYPIGSSPTSRLFVCSPAEDQVTETKRLGSPGLSNREIFEAPEMQVGDNEYSKKKRSFNSCIGEFSGSRGCQKKPLSEMDLVKGDSSACTSKKNHFTTSIGAEDFQQCSEAPNLSQEVVYSNDNSEHSGLLETVFPEVTEKNPVTYGGGSLIPTTFLDEAPETDIAGRFGPVDDDIVTKSPGNSMQQCDDTNEHSMEFVKDELRSLMMSGDGGMPEFLDISVSAGHAATRSTSGIKDEALNSSDGQVILPSLHSHNAAKQLRNSETIASDAIAAAPAILKSIPHGSALDYSPTRPTSDCLMFLEPKQLDFDERGEDNFRDKSNLSGKLDQLERSTDKVLDASLPLPSTSDHDTVSGDTVPQKFLIAEQRVSPKAVEISSSPSNSNIKDHCDVQLEARGSLLSEYSVPESIGIDSEPYVSNSELSILVDIAQAKVTMEDPGSEKHAKISYGEVYGPELQDEDGITDKEIISASNSLKSKQSMETNIQEVGTSVPNNSLAGQQGQNCVEGNPYLSIFASESCANTEYSTQQVLDSPTLGENDLLTRDSDDSPFGSLLKSMGLRISKDSVAQNLRSLEVDSWPSSKRRKIQDKETVCFSTSPSFRVKKDLPSQMDSTSVRKVSSSVDKEEAHEMALLASEEMEARPRPQVKELALTSENSGEHADTSSSSSPNQVGGTVFNLTEVVARYSEVCMVEETKFAGTSADRTEDNDQENHLHLGNSATLERSHLHRKSFSGVDGHLLSGFSRTLFKRGLDLTLSDQSSPELEGFIIDQPTEHEEVKTSGHAINFDELELLRTSLERASILEQLCASTVSHTPSNEFSPSLKLNESSKTCQSVPNGLLECMDLKSISAFNADVTKQPKVSCMSNANDHLLQKKSHSDSLLNLGARFGWSSRDLPKSPIGKLWVRMSLHTGSSEKRLSSNPELTCFPIEEDPSSSEENEDAPEVNEVIQKDSYSIADSSAKRQPLANITNIIAQPPIFGVEKSVDRVSLDSISTELSLKGTYKKGKPMVDSYCRNDGEDKEDDSLAVAASTSKDKKELTASNMRKRGLPRETSLRREMSKLSEKKPKHSNSNIVSNVTSFVPLVKQKQAAAVCAVKRDVKVKALEIAEAAKRLEEKKDNERKMRKEALKLERAKTEQENLKQMEVNKKKKEEERKKKNADVAARKRQREEEEKKERERKRKRLEENQRMRKEGGTMCTQKVEKQKQLCDHDEKDVKTKEPDNRLRKRHDSVEACATSSDSSRHMKESTSLGRTGPTGNMRVPESEKSYDISPYHCSDEDDDGDELEEEERSKKFVPSWASKNCVALVLPSQQRVQPELIFPPQSFCSIDEVCTSSKARRNSQTRGQ